MKAKTIIFFLLFPTYLCGQINLHPETNKDKRSLKNQVLKNTDHFYLGIETGLLFDFSSAKAVDPNFNDQVYNGFLGQPYKDFLITANGRLSVGYRYKSHYFEIGYAGYHSIFKRTPPPYTTSGQRVTKYLGAVQLGYYYRLPFKSQFYDLSIGPEIGIAFNYAWDVMYSPYFSDDPPPELEFRNSGACPLFGFSIRNEFKIKKNLTVFARVSGTYVYVRYAQVAYNYDWSSSGPIETLFHVSPINFVISFGLKFDFYSKKKKQQTYDALGISDPYKK